MTQYLENNLTLQYPFADGVTVPAVGVIADMMLSARAPGPYTLDVFNPNYNGLSADPLDIMQIEISNAEGVVLSTAAAVSTALPGGFIFVSAEDTTRESVVRLILDASGVVTLAGLPSPQPLAGGVGYEAVAGLSSLNGLSGDVILDLPDYSIVDTNGSGVILGFAAPRDRVDCSGVDCDRIYALGGARADGFGSLIVDATECYRLTPDPDDPHTLILRNFCDPCTSCDDVAAVNDKIAAQASYYHRLSAIHHNQFNRYQRAIAAVNQAISEVQSQADINTPEGPISIVSRVFNRPYFTQLYVVVVNNTTYSIDVTLDVSITPAEVNAQLTPEASSFLVQRSLNGGQPFSGFSGFPGSYNFTIDPQDSVGLNSESKRTAIDNDFTTGQWAITATVDFLSGPQPLPGQAVVSKTVTPDIQLFGATPTTGGP